MPNYDQSIHLTMAKRMPNSGHLQLINGIVQGHGNARAFL